jgi:eukaryotic translation initiation factor 2C
MVKIPSSVLSVPVIYYRGDRRAKERNGRWNLDNGQQFRVGDAANMNWKLLVGPGVTINASKVAVSEFGRQLKECGVTVKTNYLGIVQLASDSEADLETTLKGLVTGVEDDRVPNLVVLLLKSKSIAVYSNFKYLTDKVFCLNSICITEGKLNDKHGNLKSGTDLQQHMANVAMKANLKMSGVNHTAQGVNRWLHDTFVIGADVTHPGSGAIEHCPSIVGVVGSMDDDGGRFRGILRVQKKQEVSHATLVVGNEIQV